MPTEGEQPDPTLRLDDDMLRFLVKAGGSVGADRFAAEMLELRAALRTKDAQIAALRDTLDQTHRALFDLVGEVGATPELRRILDLSIVPLGLFGNASDISAAAASFLAQRDRETRAELERMAAAVEEARIGPRLALQAARRAVKLLREAAQYRLEWPQSIPAAARLRDALASTADIPAPEGE